MSASLLNTANLAAAQPGAAQGIAQQGAHAAQAQGPLAGFEALLAAFFGDQAVAAPAGAGQAAGAAQAALLAGDAKVAGSPDKPADGKAGKTAGKANGGKEADLAQAAGAAAGSATTAPDATTLALLTPATTAQVQAAPAAGASPDIDDQGGQPPAGQTPKTTSAAPAASAASAAGQLAAAVAATDDKTAKAVAPGASVIALPNTPTPDAAQATPEAKPAVPQAMKADAAPAPAPLQTAAPAAAAAPAALAAQTPPLSPPVPQAPRAGEPSRGNGEPKDKALPVHAARVEGAPSAPPAIGAAAKPGEAVAAAAADLAGKDAGADEHSPNGPPAAEAKPEASDPAQPAAPFTTATNAAASAANASALAHAATVRGSPQTVANLAAAIAKKLDGRSTRFDVQLDPAGLGKVDVRVEIDAAGKMTAAMAFDNQQAASELKSRAGELQRALEQAGFDLSGGLSFDVASQGGERQAQGQDASQPAFRGRAFQAVLDGGADSAAQTATYTRRASASGVDIRI